MKAAPTVTWLCGSNCLLTYLRTKHDLPTPCSVDPCSNTAWQCTFHVIWVKQVRCFMQPVLTPYRHCDRWTRASALAVRAIPAAARGHAQWYSLKGLTESPSSTSFTRGMVGCGSAAGRTPLTSAACAGGPVSTQQALPHCAHKLLLRQLCGQPCPCKLQTGTEEPRKDTAGLKAESGATQLSSTVNDGVNFLFQIAGAKSPCK